MKIFTTDLPEDTQVKKAFDRIDYNDSFGFYITNKKATVTDVARAFFTGPPKWIIALMKFRDKLGGIIGLKTMGKQNEAPDFAKIEFLAGEKYGLFQILEHHPKEIIMGTDDKHLNFRVSLYLPDSFDNEGRKKVVISTVVKMHNVFGRLYIKLVQPFHRLVVPSMMRKICRRLAEMH